MNKKYYRLDRLLVNLGYGVWPEVRLFIINSQIIDTLCLSMDCSLYTGNTMSSDFFIEV